MTEQSKPDAAPEPYVRDDGKTVIRNTCGHNFAYQIRKPSSVKWLQGRPCPSCVGKQGGRGNKRDGNPGDQSKPEPQPERPTLKDIEQGAPEPQPEPESKPEPQPEPDSADVAAWLEGVPALPENAVFHSVLPDVLLLLRANVNVWLQGPPGTGKSTIAQQAAEALGLAFYPESCHEMMTQTSLFGYRDANGVDHRTPLWDAYEHGGVVNLDEVDNGNPNLLAALNSALSNGHCVFGSGTVVNRHPDFRCVATANTAGLGPESGYIGRNGVDLATRDRFVTVFVPVDDVLESALIRMARSEDASAHRKAMALNAAERFRMRALNALKPRSTDDMLAACQLVRAEVERRFRGSVVSTRTLQAVATMSDLGFTFREALAAKLPGITAADVEALAAGVSQ